MKILLIEDSALSRTLFKRAAGDGYTYLEARDGAQGLELYFLEKPDLVVLDITLPGTNGMEVLAQLKRLDPQARVIIGTSDIQTLTREEAMRMGADAYLQKPFTGESVRKAISTALPETCNPGTGENPHP